MNANRRADQAPRRPRRPSPPLNGQTSPFPPLGLRLRQRCQVEDPQIRGRRRYAIARRLNTNANNSFRGYADDSSTTTRRVLRRTTAPIFSNANRMVPT